MVSVYEGSFICPNQHPSAGKTHISVLLAQTTESLLQHPIAFISSWHFQFLKNLSLLIDHENKFRQRPMRINKLITVMFEIQATQPSCSEQAYLWAQLGKEMGTRDPFGCGSRCKVLGLGWV